ncbi:MAG TPA: DUF1232 domain-containing protein [Candidatus Acidoferrum sp.]|nr:DUF1232 domain-containing protein [Candidatus Acidoferrum sp.]
MDLTLVVAIVIGIVVVWIALLVLFWVLRPKGTTVRELLGVIPDVLRLLRSIIGDRTAPLDVRVVLMGLVVWLVSPIDLIPDFIPVIGPMDDIVVSVVAMRYVRRRLGVEELRRRWVGTADGFELLVRIIGTA